MPVTVYKSDDAGAPVLNGLVGSLCTVLDAVLVNGYGAKAAAGWAIAFTGTNKRAYRPPSGLLRGYLRVQDDAPRAAPFNNACEARINCFEVMTTIDAGTGRYPTAAALNVILEKSSEATATAKPWIVIADECTVYMFVQSGDFGLGWASFMAGEIYSLKTADAYNGMLIGNVTETLVGAPTQLVSNENLPKFSAVTAVTAGHYMPRGIQQQGPLITTTFGVGKHGHPGHSAVGLVGLTLYPNPVDNGIYLSQVTVHEPIGLTAIRGRLRGFWHQLHPASTLRHGDTWSGTGALAGKTFMAIGPVPDGLGTFVMETSDTWETN